MQNPYEFDCEFINELSVNSSKKIIKRKGELLNNNISKTRKLSQDSYNRDSYKRDSYKRDSYNRDSCNEIKLLYKKLKIS